MIFSSDLLSSSSAWQDTEDQLITTIPESSRWYSRFTEENKLLLALVYGLRCVSMYILLLFKKSHCGRHVLLLSRSTKPPFRLRRGIFFFLVRKTFLMFHFLLISDFAYYCMSQLKIYGTMPCKSFSEVQLSKTHCKSSWSVKNLQLSSLLNWSNRSQNGRKCTCKWKRSHESSCWCLGHGQILKVLLHGSIFYRPTDLLFKYLPEGCIFVFCFRLCHCLHQASPLTDLISCTRPSNEKLLSSRWWKRPRCICFYQIKSGLESKHVTELRDAAQVLCVLCTFAQRHWYKRAGL